MIQPGGETVIWGADFAVDGQAKGKLVRVKVDGNVNNTFTFCSCLLTVSSVALQTDGKLIVAGSLNNQANLVTINADGSNDTTFNNAVGGFESSSAELEPT